jgi:hypothetical protein
MVPPRAIPDHVEWLLGSVSFRWKLSLSLSLAADAQLGFGFELSSPIDFFAISSLLFVDFQRIEIMRRIWFDLCEYRNFLLGFFVWF